MSDEITAEARTVKVHFNDGSYCLLTGIDRISSTRHGIEITCDSPNNVKPVVDGKLEVPLYISRDIHFFPYISFNHLETSQQMLGDRTWFDGIIDVQKEEERAARRTIRKCRCK